MSDSSPVFLSRFEIESAVVQAASVRVYGASTVEVAAEKWERLARYALALRGWVAECEEIVASWEAQVGDADLPLANRARALLGEEDSDV